MSAITIDPGFEGFPPAWYYLDRKAGKLASALPSGSVMATSDKVSLSLWPRFLNAPPKAMGANDKTQFAGRGKPNAYLKLQVIQDRAGAGTIKPLTWTAIYPVLDGPRDDITNKYFADPVSGEPIDAIPLPGSTAKIQISLTAVVGGASPNALVGILDKVLGVAGSGAGKTLFPIPAADIILAGNIEALLNLASSAFASDTKQQYWLNETATPVRLTVSQDPGDDALLFPKGTSFMAAFPDPPDHGISNAVDAIAANAGYTIDMDRGGVLFAKDKTGVVTPNPFANLIYVTFRVIVSEG